MGIKEAKSIEYFTLSSGDKIPAIGFGSGTKWKLNKLARPEEEQGTLDDNIITAIAQAIELGFTHIDTAEIYETHLEVAAGIKRSGIERSKLWITDKYSPGFFNVPASSARPYDAITTALKELEVGYIDLYLLHAQFFDPVLSRGITLKEAWKDLERAQEEGLVKNIGLSNFDVTNIESILEFAKVKPAVLQIEFHPYLQNQTPKIIEFAKKNDIVVEAYSPLAPLSRDRDGPLKDLLPGLSRKYGKTEPQILLRWTYQQGILPITTSSDAQRVSEALKIFDFKLEPADAEEIAKIGQKHHFRGFFAEEFGLE